MKLLSIKVSRTDIWEFKALPYKPLFHEDFSYGAEGTHCSDAQRFVLTGSNKNLTSDPMVDRHRVFLLRVNGRQASL